MSSRLKLCFIADARSPIAQNWIKYFIKSGHDVHVISSYDCTPEVLPGAHLYFIPLGLTGLSRIKHDGSLSEDNNVRKNNNPVRSLLAQLRSGRLSFISDFVVNWVVPMDLYRQAPKLKRLILEINPDLVHAMRIPKEGVAAALATPKSIPLILSVWGNDFTLWAQRNFLRAYQTNLALKRAVALHSDCKRDLRLGIERGFDPTLPTIVVPGAGGIDLDHFRPDAISSDFCMQLDIPDDAVVILNPRGIRGYVRNEVFFSALIDVVAVHQNIHVLCTGMKNNPVVENWVSKGKLQPWVTLLPNIQHSNMAKLYNLADISVSISEHDGTPNSLLEAMASGCFIVAGDIESVREWVSHSINGLLCDPTDISSVATAIIQAIKEPQLRKKAAHYNREKIEKSADYRKVMPKVYQFYEHIIL